MGVIGDARNDASGGAALYGSALWTSIEGSFADTSPTASGLSRPGRHLLPRQRVSFPLVDGQGGVGVVKEHLHPFLGVHVDTDLPGDQLLLGERLHGNIIPAIARQVGKEELPFGVGLGLRIGQLALRLVAGDHVPHSDVGHPGVEGTIFDRFLFDGVDVDRLQQQVDGGAGAGNGFPISSDETNPPFDGPVEVCGRRSLLCLDQLTENRATSTIRFWKSGALGRSIFRTHVAVTDVGERRTGAAPRLVHVMPAGRPGPDHAPRGGAKVSGIHAPRKASRLIPAHRPRWPTAAGMSPTSPLFRPWSAAATSSSATSSTTPALWTDACSPAPNWSGSLTTTPLPSTARWPRPPRGRARSWSRMPSSAWTATSSISRRWLRSPGATAPG